MGNITLDRYLQDCKTTIALLFMTETGIDCKEYKVEDFDDIPSWFRKMEVLDTNVEEECVEVWIG